MKCPYCNAEQPDGALYCSECKHELPISVDGSDKKKNKRAPRGRIRRWIIAVTVLFSLMAACLCLYCLVFWIDNYNIDRLYLRGAYAPTINLYSLDDGRQGHAVIFYGADGDVIYLPELDESLSIVGGVARLEIPDSDWFAADAGEYDRAEITFAPVLIKANGAQTQLPKVNYTVDVPESPLTVTSPATDGVRVVTSSYPLELKVVPGSSVYVNGTDITQRIDRAGDFSADVIVKAIGTNTYTIIVRTPQHKETRRDVTIYREDYDIEIELDSEVATRTSENTMTISGKCEPGAVITVDTDYMEQSLVQDMEVGTFSFIARLNTLGDNIIRFRASKEGREDAVVTFTVYYKPTLASYAAKAWKMDYDQLRRLYENWLTRIFLCKGPIVDSFISESDGKHYMVMDVRTEGDEPQYVILENDTTLTSPSLGTRYSAYADVSGRYFYQDNYYPMLIARYIDLAN